MFDLQWLGWIIAGVNIIGAVLNARLNRICFLFFLMSSISWVFYNVYTKTYEQIPLWVFFTATNIYGLYYWPKAKSRKGKLFNNDEVSVQPMTIGTKPMLIITRGAPGSGKSSFVTEMNLSDFTLNTDRLRLMFEAPVKRPDGTLKISQDNDRRIWGLLFSMLENRMKKGSFTVIDACHCRAKSLKKYLDLARVYNYDTVIIDFSDIPLKTLIERNRTRLPKWTRVPEHIVNEMYDKLNHIDYKDYDYKVMTPSQFKSRYKSDIGKLYK